MDLNELYLKIGHQRLNLNQDEYLIFEKGWCVLVIFLQTVNI